MRPNFRHAGLSRPWSWVLAVLLLACRAPASHAQQSQSYQTCAGEVDLRGIGSDSALVHAGILLEQAAPRVRSLWSGFWPVDEDVLVRRRGSVAWVGMGRTPPGELAAIEQRVIRLDGSSRALHLFAADSARVDTLLRRIGGSAAGRSLDHWALSLAYPSLGRGLQHVYHEHFHRFQMRHFSDFRTPPRGSGQRDQVRMAEPEFASRIDLENTLLRAALHTASPDSMRDLLRTYLAVRHVRTGQDEELRRSERQLERIEGTAWLVGTRAAAEAVECGTDGLGVHLGEDLVRMGARSASRAYFAGAALGHLLDRLGAEWAARVHRGEFLDAIVAEAVGFDPARAAYLDANIRNQAGSATHLPGNPR